jgi:hypothetical protein
MAKFFKIPLTPVPQIFTIQLSGIDYRIRLSYQNTDAGGWVMDILDINDKPIVNGIPLVTGADLLEQYKYLGFGGRMWVQTASDPDAVPTFLNLGVDAQVYYVTD